MDESTKRLRHMLGMDSDTPGYRNNYHCPGDDPVMLEMLERGLVSWRPVSWNGCGGIWRATTEGRKAVGAPTLHEKNGGQA